MMQILNRNQLASQLAVQAQITEGQATAALRGFCHLVVNGAKRGERIELDGFGLFECIQRDNGQQALIFRQALNIKEELNRCL